MSLLFMQLMIQRAHKVNVLLKHIGTDNKDNKVDSQYSGWWS